MILYGSIIFVCVCLLTGVNAVFAAPRFGVSFWFILGAVLINVVAVFSGFGKGKKVLRKTKNPQMEGQSARAGTVYQFSQK